jgi:hypothetical protein
MFLASLLKNYCSRIMPRGRLPQPARDSHLEGGLVVASQKPGKIGWTELKVSPDYSHSFA